MASSKLKLNPGKTKLINNEETHFCDFNTLVAYSILLKKVRNLVKLFDTDLEQQRLQNTIARTTTGSLNSPAPFHS